MRKHEEQTVLRILILGRLSGLGYPDRGDEGESSPLIVTVQRYPFPSYRYIFLVSETLVYRATLRSETVSDRYTGTFHPK